VRVGHFLKKTYIWKKHSKKTDLNEKTFLPVFPPEKAVLSIRKDGLFL